MKYCIVAIMLIAALTVSFVPVCRANEPPDGWRQWTSPDGYWTLSYPDDWRISEESETNVAFTKPSRPRISVEIEKSDTFPFPLDSSGMEILESSVRVSLANLGLEISGVTAGYWTDGVQGIFAEAERETTLGTQTRTQTLTYVVYHTPDTGDQAWLCFIISDPLSEDSKELIGHALASTSLADEPVPPTNAQPADWLQWTSPAGDWTVSYPDNWEVHSATNDEVRLVTYYPSDILVDMTKLASSELQLGDVGMQIMESYTQSKLADLGLDASAITSGHWTHGVQGVFAEAEIEGELGSGAFTFIVFHSPNAADRTWLCMIVSFPLSEESKELIGKILASTSLTAEPALPTITFADKCDQQQGIRICLTQAELTDTETRLHFTVENNTPSYNLLASRADIALAQDSTQFEPIADSLQSLPDLPHPVQPGVTAQTAVTFDATGSDSTVSVVWNGVHVDDDSVAFDAFKWEFNFGDAQLSPSQSESLAPSAFTFAPDGPVRPNASRGCAATVVYGVVRDARGEPLGGVNLRLRDSTGTDHLAVSNPSADGEIGLYEFRMGLPSAPWRLRVVRDPDTSLSMQVLVDPSKHDDVCAFEVNWRGIP